MLRADIKCKWLTALTFAFALSACAGAPRDASLPIDDPNKSFNRNVFGLNQVILHPPATVVKALPSPVIDRLRGVDDNLKEPRIFVNDVLQGRINAAQITLGRFIFNSTFGLAGMFDVAAAGGLPRQTGDFGQTLFVWGVGAGPYAVRPYFGPSTTRDTVGSVVDLVADPVGLSLSVFGWKAAVASAGLDAIVHLGELKEAEDSSIDFYSFLRSDYYQIRRAELREAIGLPVETESPATASPAVAKPIPKVPKPAANVAAPATQ